MKKKKKRKVRRYIFITLLALFLIYNIFWFLCIYRPYTLLGEEISQKEDGSYCYIEDGISYYVSPPQYLDLTGNLSIGPASIRDGDSIVNLILWRNIDGSYRVGVSLEAYKLDSDGTVECEAARFEMDEDMNIYDSNPALEELLKDNIEIIEHYYELAYDKWGILGNK